MRIAVMGAGGLGGYLGACLARAGNDVTLLARGANLDARGAGDRAAKGDRDRRRGDRPQREHDGHGAAAVQALDAVDLERGRRLEVEWIQGAVVRLGEEVGVPTPLNRELYAVLKPLAVDGQSA